MWAIFPLQVSNFPQALDIFSKYPCACLNYSHVTLQDLLALSPSYNRRPAMEEIINDPTNPRHYWRFRIHVPLEHLLADQRFVSQLQTLLLGGPFAPLSDMGLLNGLLKLLICLQLLGG